MRKLKESKRGCSRNKQIYLIFEGLTQGVTGRGLQLVAVRFVDDLNDLVFGLLDGGDNVGVSAWIGNCVTDTDTVTFQEQPVVDHGLNVAVKFAVFLKEVLSNYFEFRR